MPFARWDLLNALARTLDAASYLEIGVQRGECFARVDVPRKVGVDPLGPPATVRATSNQFFASLPPTTTFDLVFVDGLHHREQVFQDILNAVKHLSPGGAILVHDCDPPTEQAGSRPICGGVWCGDVWRGWMDARHALGPDAYMAMVKTDLGCGLVLPGDVHDIVQPSPLPPWSRETTDKASWQFFHEHRQEWQNAISTDDFLAIVARLRPVHRHRFPQE